MSLLAKLKTAEEDLQRSIALGKPLSWESTTILHSAMKGDLTPEPHEAGAVLLLLRRVRVRLEAQR